ncbi:MAG: NAD(P)/FAD-dependent oxidoreductase [Sneathiella sp.]|nr:NAD(P)/FAD-dependent oxidoreductase [Sneathiella sp.]
MNQTNNLDVLEATIVRDFSYINYPSDNWVKPRFSGSGEGALDVAIIGAGACGMAAAFGLISQGVRNLALFDQSAPGQEGPWITTARMKTLRSPKHLTGPNMGLPNLTFRAWFEAQWGIAQWEALDKIPKEMWMTYLVWYRKVLDLPVTNHRTLTGIEPQGDLFRLTFSSFEGDIIHFARHVVLATGRAATGGASLPTVAASLPARFYAHTEEVIDFGALEGKRVAVIGGAASAADNAATALEAGAAEVQMLVRAPVLPRLNKFKSIVYPGFMKGFASLNMEDRWRFLKHGFDARIAAPRSTMLRLKQFDNFKLHTGAGIRHMAVAENHVKIETGAGDFSVDYVIFGTGYAMDLKAQPEIAPFFDDILLWKDCFAPKAGEEDETLERYPYLGAGFEFLPKEPGTAAYLERLHLFNAAATLTHAPVSSDIPGVNTGVDRLVDHLVKALFRASSDQHLEDFYAYDEPELLGDEWRED